MKRVLMPKFWLTASKWTMPSGAEVLIENSEDNMYNKYSYIWREEDVDATDVRWDQNLRLRFSNWTLDKAQAKNQTIVHRISSSGRYIDLNVVDSRSLLHDGYVSVPNLTENYKLFVENEAEQRKINPQKNGNWEPAPKQQIENTIDGEHGSQINSPPTNDIMGEFDMVRIVVLLGGMVLLWYMYTNGMI